MTSDLWLLSYSIKGKGRIGMKKCVWSQTGTFFALQDKNWQVSMTRIEYLGTCFKLDENKKIYYSYLFSP